MKISKQIKVVFAVIGQFSSLWVSAVAGEEPEKLAAAIHYIPPTNFYVSLSGNRNDPGDNPLTPKDATFLGYRDKSSQCAQVSFSLGLAGAYVGEGKVLKFLPVDPKKLGQFLEIEYRNKFPQVSPVAVANQGGQVVASLTATRPLESELMPYFLHFRWILLETNAVLKVMGVSCNAADFKAITNSMASIRVDKAQLLKAYAREDPK